MTGAIHGLHVQIEREVPIFFRTLKDGAVVNIAGTIEQNIDSSQLGGKIVNALRLEDIQSARANVGPILADVLEQFLVYVSCPYQSSLVGKSDSGCASDALSCGCDDSSFSCKSSTHIFIFFLIFSQRRCIELLKKALNSLRSTRFRVIYG